MAAGRRGSASAAEKQAHFNELMGCLMTVFAEPVEAAGFEMPRPPVVVYTRPIKTACGDFAEVNAAYCTGDQRVYYANSLLRAFPARVANAPYAAEVILAHEFGHAIQARAAILISEKYLEQDARTEREAMDLSRRTEVQADCLAGQYVRSVAQSQSLGAARAARARASWRTTWATTCCPDARAIGRPRHRRTLARTGSTAASARTTVGVCNTFVAGSDEVR